MHLLDACTRVQPELRSDKEERITMLALKTNPLKPMRSFRGIIFVFLYNPYVDEIKKETGAQVKNHV